MSLDTRGTVSVMTRSPDSNAPRARTRTSPAGRSLAAARAAVAERRWPDALAAFHAADEAGLLEREDLDAYGDAAWWVGELTTAIRVRERAFAAHLTAEDEKRAGLLALQLVNDYSHRLQGSMATGWLRRAERLLEALPESAEHAHLARQHLNVALGRGDLDEALRQADLVLDIGRRLRNRDIEALGLQDKGRVLVASGAVTEGLELLDEAVVRAISDELSPLATAIVYCNSTVACQDLADYRRAAQFADAAREWCDRQAITGFPGMCRVRRAEVTRLRGAWAEAETEARQACSELADFCLDYAGEGFYQIGEIRLRVGDLAGADAAFVQAHQLGRNPVPGLALLRAAQGKPAAGAALLKRAMDDTSTPPLLRARLLAAAAEIHLALGDVAGADDASRELRAIADQFGSQALLASAAAAIGAVALERDDLTVASTELERARRLWQETEAPYEVARARLLLAEAHRRGRDADAAAFELRAALEAFQRLGAVPDAERSRAALAQLEDQPARTVDRTMMFTDIVRSTDLVEAIGDAAWGRLRDWHDRTIRRVIEIHRGEEVDHAGDGFFVVFNSPDDALACAVEIQRSLAEQRREHGFAPSVRIGLHAGELIQSASGYGGRSVHLAARIAALAEGDEIVASADVLRAAGHPPAHLPSREVTLRGIRRPVEVATLSSSG